MYVIRKIALTLIGVGLLSSCQKTHHCQDPYTLIPVLAQLGTSTLDGLDRLVIEHYDSAAAQYVRDYTVDGTALILLPDSVVNTYPGGWSDYVAYFWSGRTYRMTIPGRGRSWIISDISREPDGINRYDVTGEACPHKKVADQLQPKSFKVNGVEQESRVINIDR